MLCRFKEKIKKKKGVVAIFLCMLMTLMIALMAYAIDGGKNYCYKQQLQAVADSISLAGAKQGITKNKNDFGGSKINYYVDKPLAVSKANSLLNANKPYLSVSNIKVEYNLANKGSSYEDKLYMSGIFHVKITADIENIFTKSKSSITVASTTQLITDADSSKANITKVDIVSKSSGDYIIITYANGTKQELRVDN